MEWLILILLVIILAEVTLLITGNKVVKFGPKKRAVFIDTSVLIDGRIQAIAETGFMGDILYVPRSVVAEMQFLADNSDHDKRARARHGLDVLRELQLLTTADVRIYNDAPKAPEGVDERLLKLAKKHRGIVCTIDFNLNKVAQVEGVEVLNINELAKVIRMAYLPGERYDLELVQKGQDTHQAVGYLQDGTMVVVEDARKSIGSTVEVEFIRSLQTAAGKMMFARMVNQQKSDPVPKSKIAKLKQQKPAQDKPKPNAQPSTKKQSNQRGRKQTSKDHESILVELANR